MKKLTNKFSYGGYNIEIYHHIALENYTYIIKNSIGDTIISNNTPHDEVSGAYVSACLKINDL